MAELSKKEINDIIDEALGAKASAKSVAPVGMSKKEVDDIIGQALGSSKPVQIKETATGRTGPLESYIQSGKFGSSFLRGATDAMDTARQGVTALNQWVAPESELTKRSTEAIQKDTVARSQYDTANPPAEGIVPTYAQVGRAFGQIAATAPLVPAKAIQGIRAITGALPTAAGAAPLVNRLFLAAPATGAVGGAAFGTGTISTKGEDESALGHVGKNVLGGIIAGPALAATGGLLASTVKGVGSLWANMNINKLASDAGLPTKAVKSIIDRLEEAGYTPKEAQIALNKLGPKATLADLGRSLETEASGYASLGGKSTAIIKGRFDDRASKANTDVAKIMEKRLGPKPDLKAEKINIVDEAQRLTGPDYTRAKASGAKLDANSVAKYIDEGIESGAVGEEAKRLNEIKGYLYKSDGTLKDDVKTLHKVRIAIDDTLDKLPKEGTSQKSGVYRAVEGARKEVDTLLKTVPEMAAADAKFAEKMTIAKGLDVGYEAIIKSMRKEDFKRVWKAATPEVQETIKKGMRAAIGDLMEAAQKGELSGAVRLLGQKSVNQSNVKLAFGEDGQKVLNEIAKSGAFRRTEGLVTSGSQTAERRAFQERHAEAQSSGLARDIASGLALDATSGSPFVGTAIMGIKKGGGKLLHNISQNRYLATTESEADILSRSGKSRKAALEVMKRVEAIRKHENVTGTEELSDIIKGIKLPVTAPSGVDVNDKLKKQFPY